MLSMLGERVVEMTFAQLLLILLVALAFYTDATTMRIPNPLTGAAVILAAAYYLIADGWRGIVFSLTGLAVSFVALLPLYWIGAVGAGDVKLFAAVGALSGTHFALYSLLYSIFYGGLIGMGLLLLRKQFFPRMGSLFWGVTMFVFLKQPVFLQANTAEYVRFPFMYAVVPGISTAFWYIFCGI